jgi:exodeoxyribonuclease-3
VSWNINGIRSCSEEGFREFIAKVKPDILCLQETKAHPDQVPPALSRPPHYTGYWSTAHRRGYSGVASFFLKPPHKISYGLGIRKYDTEGRFVISEHEDFKLYNVYFPNGGSGEARHLFKQEFLQRFTDHLANEIALGRSLIVVGDYNVAHREIDVFDPVRLSKVSGFLPEERKWLDRFLEIGFIDSFRHFYPQARDRYSWWSYRENARVGNRGWRIDMICVTKDLLPRLQSADILENQQGSDHCPVVLEMN